MDTNAKALLKAPLRWLIFVTLLTLTFQLTSLVQGGAVLTRDECSKPCLSSDLHCLYYSCIRQGSMISCELNGISSIQDNGTACVSPTQIWGFRSMCKKILKAPLPDSKPYWETVGDIVHPLHGDTQDAPPILEPNKTTPVNKDLSNDCVTILWLAVSASASFILGQLFMFLVCCYCNRHKRDIKEQTEELSSILTSRQRQSDTRHILLSTESSDSGLSTSRTHFPLTVTPSNRITSSVESSALARNTTTSLDPSYMETNQSVGSRQEGHDYDSIMTGDYQYATAASINSRSLVGGSIGPASSLNYEDLGEMDRETNAYEDHDYDSMYEDQKSLPRTREQKKADKRTKHDYLNLQPNKEKTEADEKAAEALEDKTMEIKSQQTTVSDQGVYHEYFILEKQKEGCDACQQSDKSKISSSPAAHSYMELTM